MTTLKGIEADLAHVAHASQNKAVLGQLLAYLREAGVRTPEEKEIEMNEERHRRVAQAETVQELDAVVEGWGADFKPDADLERAVDERDAYLAQQQKAADEASDAADAEPVAPETGDYASWDKTKLVNESRNRQLPVSGTKDELVARLAKDDERREADAAVAAATGEMPAQQ
jgi:hypothetical protein